MQENGSCWDSLLQVPCFGTTIKEHHQARAIPWLTSIITHGVKGRKRSSLKFNDLQFESSVWIWDLTCLPVTVVIYFNKTRMVFKQRGNIQLSWTLDRRPDSNFIHDFVSAGTDVPLLFFQTYKMEVRFLAPLCQLWKSKITAAFPGER